MVLKVKVLWKLKYLLDKKNGDIIGKIALNNSGDELLKKALICDKDISQREFEKLFQLEGTNN